MVLAGTVGDNSETQERHSVDMAGLRESSRFHVHRCGFRVHIETNGTRPLPAGIDWITLSPKEAPVVLQRADEIKLVYTGDESGIAKWLGMDGEHFLQPCDTLDAAKNRSLTERCIAYIKKNPEWRLSLQTHKLLKIR